MSLSDTTPPTWRKSSRCVNCADCVEVADLPAGVAGVRDSKRPDAAVLTFPVATFAAFVAAITSGRFDRPVC